jgi:hypothetical protein
MLDALIAAVRLSIGLTVLSVFKTVKGFKDLYWSTYAYIWDVELHILNQFAPERDPNKVIPPNKPGAYGEFSLYFLFILFLDGTSPERSEQVIGHDIHTFLRPVPMRVVLVQRSMLCAISVSLYR